jgi:hypothetical protein
MRYPINYLDEYIQAPHTTFIGATTYNTGRVRTSFNGIWEGYQLGENIFEAEYGFTYPNTRFGDNLLAQIKSLEILFRNAHRYMTSETVILLSNQRVIDWMEKGQYKWMDKLDVKSQLFVWFQAVKPRLVHYNSLQPPYSLLREYINITKKRDYLDLVKHGIKKNEDYWTNIRKSSMIQIVGN